MKLYSSEETRYIVKGGWNSFKLDEQKGMGDLENWKIFMYVICVSSQVHAKTCSMTNLETSVSPSEIYAVIGV